MSSLQKKIDEVWLIIDARTANQELTSGIARFVTGLTSALCHELSQKRKSSPNVFHNLKILIVAKSEPADWIVKLIYTYPELVSFWSHHKHGIFIPKMDKPTWLWPTLVIKKIQNMTGNKLIWLSPANFDRPLFISRSLLSSRVIQVIHDSIPFTKFPGFGFLFQRQFRFLVSRALAKLPNIITVSQSSAQALLAIGKKKLPQLKIVHDAVEDTFGHTQKFFSHTQLLPLRKELFRECGAMENTEPLLAAQWVLGVGRSQKYKCWDIAIQAIAKLNSNPERAKIWCVRVGADEKEIAAYSKKCPAREVGEIKIFDALHVLILPAVSDAQLSRLYSMSDLLIHPSLAEGFGLPPLEAILCGLPVLFRKGTAVDEHFEEGCLPDNFWSHVDSLYPSVWANHIERILSDKKDSAFYRGLTASSSPRPYVLHAAQTTKTFQWGESANVLLDLLGRPQGMIETILNETTHL